MNRARLAAAVAVVAVSAAACTSSGTPTHSSAPVSPVTTPATSNQTAVPPSSSAPLPSPSVTSTSPVASATPLSSSPVPTTSAPSSSATPSPTGPAACTPADLTVVGVRGGASQGVETAGVVFTNSSSGTCTMRGYPAAQLLSGGKAVGKPAMHQAGTVSTVVLKPGDAAQSLLSAVTNNCQAAVSDHARVRVPDATSSNTVTIQLRACSLRIAPLEAA